MTSLAAQSAFYESRMPEAWRAHQSTELSRIRRDTPQELHGPTWAWVLFLVILGILASCAEAIV
jgi:hypothetical protein